MKRKNLILCLLMLISASAMAQQKVEGDLSPLINVNKVNFVMEFVSIHGMDEDAFGKYETDWFKDKPEVIDIFTDYANRKLKGVITLGHFPNEAFTVKAVVNDISLKGNYNCDIIVLDSNKNLVAKVTGIKANGGVWGTKLNLIKDGAESTGKRFGIVLKTEIAKSKK